MKRRNFLRAGALAGVWAPRWQRRSTAKNVESKAAAILSGKDDRTARIGFIGVGLRGRNHLNIILRRDDCQVTAICDIDPDALAQSQKMISDVGRPAAAEYTGSELAYEEMLERDDIDGVLHRHAVALAHAHGGRHHEGR